MSIITRFAPSPTGLLHVGNVRTALINFLFARKHNADFILRIDDTDLERSTPEFESQMKSDLSWLGFTWENTFNQKNRLDRYEEVKNKLIADGRLYPCYETKEELEFKRKIQLSQGNPPIYDRSSLKLTDEEKKQYESEGKTPHYRFKLNENATEWDDMVRGHVKFEPNTTSDPILIRGNGTWTYMLCSAVDDIDYKITHVIRGEDHISNTSTNIQLFEALNETPPIFAHVSRVTAKNSEMSKRSGGFDIKSLRDKGLEPMTVINFLSSIGTSKAPGKFTDMKNIVENFSIDNFNKSPTTYEENELISLNHKILSAMEFSEIEPRLEGMDIDQKFWMVARNNIERFLDLKIWYDICKNPVKPIISDEDVAFLNEAASLLSSFSDLDENSWGEWVSKIKDATSRKGKSLFMTLRMALTGINNGPELKFLLPLISMEKAIQRLEGKTS